MSQINKPTAPLVTIDPDTKADLVNGEVPSEQLPSYVDDVLEFDSVEDFPEEGETGKIYVDLETNYTYRWSGSAYIQVGGGSSGEIEINDYSPVKEPLTRIKVNGKNFIVENRQMAPQLEVDVDTVTPETYINGKDIQHIVEDSFGGEIPLGSFLCGINLYMDEQPDPYPFYAYVFIADNGDNPPDVTLYSETGAELIRLEYDNDDGIFCADQILMPQSVEAGLAEYLEEQLGESVPVDEVHDLWLPSEQRFVKFAGGESNLITSQELDEIGRSYIGICGQGPTLKHYYIIRSIKTYSGYVDDEHLINSYTPEEYENEFNFPVPTLLTNNQSVLFPIENGHSSYSCGVHLIDSDTNVFLPHPQPTVEEDPPRYFIIQPMMPTDEPSQLIDIILEFDENKEIN